MSDGFQDMPNQRPNHIGAGLSSLAQFFSDSRVDQSRMLTMGDRLSRRGVTGAQMQRIVNTAMEECDRFPSLAWMLKLVNKRKSDGDGWGDDGPHCTPELDVRLDSRQRWFIDQRNRDLWLIRRALEAGKDPTDLLERWRLYIDHNRYVREAPHGELVRERFDRLEQVTAEIGRVTP